MPTADLKEDLDLEQLFEEDITCRLCDKTATWIVGCPHCHDFACDFHKKGLEEDLERYRGKRGVVLICEHKVAFRLDQAWFRKI